MRTFLNSAFLCGLFLAMALASGPAVGYNPGPSYGSNSHSGYGNSHSGYGSSHSGYGNSHSGYGNSHSGYGNSHSGYDNAHPGYGTGSGYHAPNDYARLAELERWTHRVAEEKIQIRKRVEMLKMQKANLLNRIGWIINSTIPDFNAVQTYQDNELLKIKRYIKDVLHRVGDKEGRLANEEAVATRQHNALSELWSRILAIVANDDKQNSRLAKIQFALFEAAKKLYEKLDANKEEAEGRVFELEYNAKAHINWINSRKCLSFSVHVPVNETGKGVVYFPENTFGGLTPTAFCALTGFSSHLTLDSHGYGYHSYYDADYQALAVTVDCKPFANYVNVHVVDGSKGGQNSVDGVYVSVKVCTFGPQSLGPHPVA